MDPSELAAFMEDLGLEDHVVEGSTEGPGAKARPRFRYEGFLQARAGREASLDVALGGNGAPREAAQW